jgi:AcrR family transcriptional regulator
MSTNPSESSTVDTLIEKATEIFSIKGYAATNLTDISDALGISRGPIYYHFKDKFGLYAAAFENYDLDVRASHADIIAKDQHIMVFMENVIFDCAQRNTRFGPNFFIGIDTIEELQPLLGKFNAMNNDIYQEKLDYVQRSIDKGEVRRNTDAKHVADLIYIIYLGLLSAIQVQMLDAYSESEIRNLVRILLRGIERYCCD